MFTLWYTILSYKEYSNQRPKQTPAKDAGNKAPVPTLLRKDPPAKPPVVEPPKPQPRPQVQIPPQPQPQLQPKPPTPVQTPPPKPQPPSPQKAPFQPQSPVRQAPPPRQSERFEEIDFEDENDSDEDEEESEEDEPVARQPPKAAARNFINKEVDNQRKQFQNGSRRGK